MTDRTENGISFENRIELRCGETKGRIFCMVMFFFLQTFGAAACAVCVRDCLVPEADLKVLMIFVAAASALLTVGGMLRTKGVLVVITAAAAGLVLYVLNMTAVNAGFRHMVLRELEAIKANYNLSFEVEAQTATPQQASAALICLALVVLLAVFFSVRFTGLSALGTLVPLLPVIACIVAGKVPRPFALMALAAFFAAINTQPMDYGYAESADPRVRRRYREHTDLIRFSNSAICLVLLGVSMLIASLIVSERQYYKNGTVAKLRSDLQQKILEIAYGEGEDKEPAGDEPTGTAAEGRQEAGKKSPWDEADIIEGDVYARAGLARGKLDVADKVTYLDEEVFRAFLPYAGATYLRTYAGEFYTGRNWRCDYSDPAGDAGREDAFFEAVGDLEGELSQTDTKTALACRIGEYAGCGEECDTGDYFRLGGFGKWLEDNASLVSGLDLESERQARALAYENCLDVPEELETLFEGAEALRELDGKDVFGAIDGVRAYLSDRAEYSLEPGRVPEGRDYIEYFLTEGRKGYCAHFASAGVMIFRSLGIPARYAEGYRVPTKSTEDPDRVVEAETVLGSGGEETAEIGLTEIAVKDRHAHAWAEVYVDGFGWYTAEVTPGYYAKEGQAAGGPGMTQGEPEAGKSDGQPSGGSKEGSGGQKPGDLKDSADKEDKEDGAGQEKKQGMEGFRVVFTVAVILAVAFAVWRLSSRKRKGNLTMRETVLEDFATIAELTLKMTGVDILDGGEAIEKAELELDGKYGIQGLDGVFDIALRARFARDCSRSDAAGMSVFKRKLLERFLAEKKGPSKLINRMKYGK